MNAEAPGARFALVADEWFDGERRLREPSTMKVVEGRLVHHGAEAKGVELKLASGG